MNRRRIARATDDPVERIDFADQLPLAHTAYGRIT